MATLVLTGTKQRRIISNGHFNPDTEFTGYFIEGQSCKGFK